MSSCLLPPGTILAARMSWECSDILTTHSLPSAYLSLGFWGQWGVAAHPARKKKCEHRSRKHIGAEEFMKTVGFKESKNWDVTEFTKTVGNRVHNFQKEPKVRQNRKIRDQPGRASSIVVGLGLSSAKLLVVSMGGGRFDHRDILRHPRFVNKLSFSSFTYLTLPSAFPSSALPHQARFQLSQQGISELPNHGLSLPPPSEGLTAILGSTGHFSTCVTLAEAKGRGSLLSQPSDTLQNDVPALLCSAEHLSRGKKANCSPVVQAVVSYVVVSDKTF